MKDYLNNEERNQLLVMMAFIQNTQGARSLQNKPNFKVMSDEWKNRNNITSEESKALKTAITYLRKFSDSVYARMNPKEKEIINKKIQKFDFRLIDDYTLQKVYRETSDRLINAAVPRVDFEKWCEEIMHCNCKGCNSDWSSCKLHQVFEDNFIPESSWNKPNCRYAYEFNADKKGA